MQDGKLAKLSVSLEKLNEAIQHLGSPASPPERVHLSLFQSEDRLYIQKRAQQCSSMTDAATLFQVGQGVDARQDMSFLPKPTDGFHDFALWSSLSCQPGRLHRQKTHGHRGGLRVDNLDSSRIDRLGGQRRRVECP